MHAKTVMRAAIGELSIVGQNAVDHATDMQRNGRLEVDRVE